MGLISDEYTTFLHLHEAQLKSSGVPDNFWPTLYLKLKDQIFDSNHTFGLFQIDYEDKIREPKDPLWVLQVIKPEGIKCNDDNQIYLVDHAWTFRIMQAKEQLIELPNLRERLCNIMGLICAEDAKKCSDDIFKRLWKFCDTYAIGNAVNVEDRIPIWYVMDEVGCAITHSDEPNFRAVPIFYIPVGLTFTVIFPVKDLDFQETVTRDFVENITDPLERKARLIPWIHSDFHELSFRQNEPDEQYFLSGHIQESLPIINNLNEIFLTPKIKVYSEYELINKYLTDERFEITEDETNADVLWYTKHFKDFENLSRTPDKFINQFPFENILTIKDLLAVVSRRVSNSDYDPETLETFPIWFPVTYNLKTELPQFVSYYQNRENLKLDNHWICKPFNLARSLDTYITSNLDQIIRLTGPKIAQKYVYNPVLFYRSETAYKVKFDVRYVILLKSVQPLKLYLYKNFFLRFANQIFELNNFEEYEKHFTVMNYNATTKLHHLPCKEFLKQWNDQYPDFPWSEIELKIVKMFKELFEGAVGLPPPKGIAPNPQSRAVYAADIILSWDNPTDDSLLPIMQPKLLEINWTPDCERACKYYPDFYNQIFSCLFLNEENNDAFISV